MRLPRRLRWKFLRLGVRWLIPPCCILRWMLDTPNHPSGCTRGRRDGLLSVYVPCLIFHRWHDSPLQVQQECGWPI